MHQSLLNSSRKKILTGMGYRALGQNILPATSEKKPRAWIRPAYLVLIAILFIIFFIFFKERIQKYAKTVNTPTQVASSEDRYAATILKLAQDRAVFKVEQPDPAGYSALQISGESGIMVDAQTGKVLFAKDSDKKMKLASLIKIMTALLTLEHKNLSDYATISEQSASVGENVMGISEGEVYTYEELLYGLILNSGNDAAYALAENVAGSEPEFVKWMNRRAAELGLTNTYFYDPSGLDDRSYTTVKDLAVLTQYALRYPEFKEIVKTVEKELPYSDNHKYLYFYNQTNLLTTYPGVAGVKTGYTEEAGLCLVTYAQNDGKEVIGVVLNSIDRKGDMVLMLDYGYNSLGIQIDHPALQIGY